MANITLGPFNTILVTAASGANRLTWPQGFNRNLDILNLGPGAVYVRADRRHRPPAIPMRYRSRPTSR